MSRELHLKRELLITLGILKSSNSGSHLTKYFPYNRLSIIFFFSIRLFRRLQCVFFVTYCCFALLSFNKNFKSHGIITAS